MLRQKVGVGDRRPYERVDLSHSRNEPRERTCSAHAQ